MPVILHDLLKRLRSTSPFLLLLLPSKPHFGNHTVHESTSTRSAGVQDPGKDRMFASTPPSRQRQQLPLESNGERERERERERMSGEREGEREKKEIRPCLERRVAFRGSPKLQSFYDERRIDGQPLWCHRRAAREIDSLDSAPAQLHPLAHPIPSLDRW